MGNDSSSPCGQGMWDCYSGLDGNETYHCISCHDSSNTMTPTIKDPKSSDGGTCGIVQTQTCHQMSSDSPAWRNNRGWSVNTPGNVSDNCNRGWWPCWNDNEGLGVRQCFACPNADAAGGCSVGQETTCNTYPGVHVEKPTNCKCYRSAVYGDRWLFPTAGPNLENQSRLSGDLGTRIDPSAWKQCTGDQQPEFCMAKNNWCINPGGGCATLGDVYRLWQLDITQDPSGSGGTSLLNVPVSLESNLVTVNMNTGPATSKFDYFTSSKALVDQIATDTNVSVGYTSTWFTANATAKAVTSNKIESTEDLKTLFLQNVRSVGTLQFNEGNVTPDMLNAQIKAAFEQLPMISDSTSEQYWIPYSDFLDIYGSHVLSALIYGSKVEIRSTVSDSATSTEDDLKFKACVELEGGDPIEGKFKADGCSGVDTKHTSSDANSSVNSEMKFWGGDASLISAVKVPGASGRTSAVDAFMNSAPQSKSAIKYGYMPIWEVLDKVYSAQPEMRQRARTLKAAYFYKAYKCNTVVDPYSSTTVIQSMREYGVDDSGLTTYGCWNKAFGCLGESTDTMYNNPNNGCGSAYRTGECGLSSGGVYNGTAAAYNAEDLGGNQYRTIVFVPGATPLAQANSTCSKVV